MFELIYLYLVGLIFYKEKLNFNKNFLIASLIFLVTDSILSLTLINKIYNLYLTTLLYYKILFTKKDVNYYLITLIAITGLIIIDNYFFSIFYLIILLFLKNKIIKHINYFTYHHKLLYILILLTYLMIFLFLFTAPLSINKLSNLTIFLFINLLVVSNMSKEINLNRLAKKYQDLKLYSKNTDILITNYRGIVHENKNQLIIIKSMLPDKRNELENYINNLLEKETKITNRWLNDLKYISLPGIKNFLNYKLIQLENNNANIEIYISSEIQKIIGTKIDIIQLDNFYTIIGVLIDNIIDAIKEQEEKLVSINVYMEQNVTHIELANTYQNYIDINNLNTLGYTTKGSNRGIGLYLVNKIIKKSKIFELDTKVDNKFFVQHLKITHPPSHLK